MDTLAEPEQINSSNEVGYNEPYRVAITGKMRSGKDTFAEMLMEIIDFQHVKFSSGITEIIEKYIGDTCKKRREAYQIIGQAMREIDEEVWIRHALKDVDTSKNIIVTDLRQANEYKLLKDNGFFIVKVIADDKDRLDRMNELGDDYSPESLNHETELAIDDIKADINVYNDSTLEDLLVKATLLKIYLDKQNNG